MIARPYYLDRLNRLRGPGLAKVLTGMRRAGKSGILRLLEHSLLEGGADPRDIVFVNLELIENAGMRSAQGLLDHIHESLREGHTCHVLIDEAQEVEDIGRAACELVESDGVDLYLTGSHSRLVERCLSDVMGGRYLEIPVFPLSFSEFVDAHPATAQTTAQLFSQYLRQGGLPHTLALENDPFALHEYLDAVYHTVIRRDVAASLGHEDPRLLDAIAYHLMDDLGNPSSASGIARTLTASGQSCSDDTVSNYVSALTGAYVFHRLRRLDLRSRAELKTQEKLYAADLGLRSALLGPKAGSMQGMLENVVYLELRRRYGEVHRAKHYTRQICFVAEGPEGRAYFQVVPSALDPTTLSATLAPLQAERDNYPKTLLTLDEFGSGSHEGILQRNICEWLLAG